jgi:outer membrane protein assembly factor BamB
MSEERPNQVYIAYKDSMYKLSERDGSVLWRFPFQRTHKADQQIGSWLHLYEANHLVFVQTEFDLWALRKSDGRQIWHYSSLLASVHPAQGKRYIIRLYLDKERMYVYSYCYPYERGKFFGGNGEMIALDLEDGSQKWKDTNFPCPDLTVHDGVLYGRDTSPEGKRMLYAFDGTTGQERWRFERESGEDIGACDPYIQGGIVYDSEYPLYAVDSRTGRQLWEQRTPHPTCFFDDILVNHGLLYADTNWDSNEPRSFPSECCCVYAFDAQTGKRVWQSEPDHWLADATLDEEGLTLVRSGSRQSFRLQALDAFHGTPRWQIGWERPEASFRLYSTGKRLYVLLGMNHSGMLQVYDGHNGARLAEYPLSFLRQEVIVTSTFSDELLYLCSTMREEGENTSNRTRYSAISAIRLVDGVALWRYEIGPLKSPLERISEVLLVSQRKS